MRAGLALVVLVGCGGPPAPTPVPVTASSQCSAASVLERHGRQVGTRAALESALPLSSTGTVTRSGQRGSRLVNLDHEGVRISTYLAGLAIENGVDRAGPWGVRGVVGVRERFQGAEASDIATSAWLWRRDYFDVTQTHVDCSKLGRVAVRYERAELGTPTLTFAEDGRLLEERHTDPDGTMASTAFEQWSEPDARGLRFPTRLVTGEAVTELEPMHGGACALLGPNGEKQVGNGAACVVAAGDRVSALWPASGVVRVPLTFLGGELLVKARVAGREVNAFVDSGAGISVLDAELPIAATFRVATDLQGEGATQKVTLGLGQLPVVDLGDLHLEALPAASVPLPALAAFGDRRPELVLGYTLFALGAVRVDYLKGTLEISKRGAALVRAGARAVPMRVLGGKLVAEVTLAGSTWPIQLDTGNAGGIDLRASWAKQHGFPGARPTATVRAQFGAGTEASSDVFLRLESASLGPISVRDALAQISDDSGNSVLVGLAGNQLFSRCDAVTFDHARRTLWLEGACDREPAKTTFGWRLRREADAKRPWSIAALFPGGSADAAGLRVGDRLVSVGGQPAGLDVTTFWNLEHGAPGTKLPVVIVRDGKTLQLTLELRVPLH